MSRIQWLGRGFSQGVDRGVLYLPDDSGIAWDGLKSVTVEETAEVGDRRYNDGMTYSVPTLPGDFEATIEAFTYPDELDEELDAGLSYLSSLKTFGFSWRSWVGEDDYELHIVYNVLFRASDLAYSSISESPEPLNFSWKATAKPVWANRISPTAHFIIDSRETHDGVMQEVEDTLYGADMADPTLPSIANLVAIFEAGAVFRVVDHGDGSWTATGPDEMIQMLDETSFEITSPSAVYISSDTYQLSSW